MRALVVYESLFGNTAAVARAVADGLAETFDVTITDVHDMPAVGDADVLLVGAPTHAFGLSRVTTRTDAAGQGEVRAGSPEVGIREYLDCSPVPSGLSVAAFDTKVDKPRLPGSAARKALRRLRALGCRPVRPAPAGPGPRGRIPSWRRCAIQPASIPPTTGAIT